MTYGRWTVKVMQEDRGMSGSDSIAELVAELVSAAPAVASDVVLFHQAIADRVGLNLSEVKCLGKLVDGPCTVGVLAEQLGLSSGAVTKMIDKLAQAGYVSREPDLADRRRVVVVGSPDRIAEITALYHGMATALREFLAECTQEQLTFLRSTVARMRDVTSLEIAKLRMR